MSFAYLSCLALCVAFQPEAKLEIGNPRPTYGHLGALRPSEGALPGDGVHVAFEIKNLKLDDGGKASYSIAIEIRDEAGKLFYEQRPYNSVAQNFLGGNSLPCSAHVEIPLDAKPGAVSWKITVVDRTTKQVATLTGKGKVLPSDFGFVQVGLFADAEAKVPMSAVAVVGDSAYLQFSLVGFGHDKEKKQPDVAITMQIVDEQGKATMAKPITGKVQSAGDGDARVIPLQFGMTLNRAGRYTIQLTAEDRVTGKSARISYGIRVLPIE